MTLDNVSSTFSYFSADGAFIVIPGLLSKTVSDEYTEKCRVLLYRILRVDLVGYNPGKRLLLRL